METGRKVKEITITALMAVLLAVFGMFRLPGILPGTEFQLSAPFAVCIAACFGYKKYIKIGILASAVQMVLGAYSIVNVTISMIFRLVAGGILAVFGVHHVTIVVSGPLGTVAGRLFLGWMTGTNPLTLIVAALPGMIFTAVGSVLMFPLMKRAVGTEMKRCQ